MVRKTPSCSSSSSASQKSPSRQNSQQQASSSNNTTRTHRKSSSSCSVLLQDDKQQNRRSTNTPDDDSDSTVGTPIGDGSSPTVHKQNLYIVSFPIIFLFNVLRSLIYQLFCIFRYLYGASSKVVYRPRKRECNIEIIVGENAQSLQQQKQQHQHQHINEQQQLIVNNTTTTLATYPLLNSAVVASSLQPIEMAHKSSPGPGDPLLAKQKHHHRRAFEYISKALKIDEENEG